MKAQKAYFIVRLIIFLLFVSIRPAVTELIIDTVFGAGIQGFNGEGRQAKETYLDLPACLFIDEIGYFYLADTGNNKIRKIDSNGIVHAVAGTGIYGNGGEDIAATHAELAHPHGVAVEVLDKEREIVRVYIADTDNNKIRMINIAGIISTIAGSGYYGDWGHNTKAKNARLAHPTSVALDKYGNVYFTDTENNKIKVIYNPNEKPDSGPIIGRPDIKNPRNGRIYIIAGNGNRGYGNGRNQAYKAHLNHPWDLVIVDDTIYFSDKGNHVIRKIESNGNISIVAGVPGVAGYFGDVLEATKEKLNTPTGLWVNGNELYFADYRNLRVRKVDLTLNKTSIIAGSGVYGFHGDGINAELSYLSHPIDVVGDKQGNLYVVDRENSRVRVIKEKGNKEKQISKK